MKRSKENKQKGLELWRAVLKNYGIELEQALEGTLMPDLGQRMQLYYDEEKELWLLRPIPQNLN
jgi:hypothetical protein